MKTFLVADDKANIRNLVRAYLSQDEKTDRKNDIGRLHLYRSSALEDSEISDH